MLAAWLAGALTPEGSQPAAPESPDETKTEMPWAAACANSVSQKLTPEGPRVASHAPKLMLRMGSFRVLTAYCAAVVMPPPAEETITRSTWASGAVPTT